MECFFLYLNENIPYIKKIEIENIAIGISMIFLCITTKLRRGKRASVFALIPAQGYTFFISLSAFRNRFEQWRVSKKVTIPAMQNTNMKNIANIPT